METLTKLEEKVLEVIKNGDLYEGVPAEGVDNISETTGIKNSILRGVISSLIQKGRIVKDEYPSGIAAYMLINID